VNVKFQFFSGKSPDREELRRLFLDPIPIALTTQELIRR